MFVYILLLLPTIVLGKLLIYEYSVKQVKIDDGTINRILSKVFPDTKEPQRFGIEHSAETLPGLLTPEYDSHKKGQKRFKKVKRACKKKFSVHNNKESNFVLRTEEDSLTKKLLMLLAHLVLKAAEYVPPEFEIKVPTTMSPIQSLDKKRSVV